MEGVNEKILALIQKMNNLESMKNFRPSHCNVIHKIITKAIAIRQKSHIDFFVLEPVILYLVNLGVSILSPSTRSDGVGVLQVLQLLALVPVQAVNMEKN